jgi:hypothetical protein
MDKVIERNLSTSERKLFVLVSVLVQTKQWPLAGVLANVEFTHLHCLQVWQKNKQMYLGCFQVWQKIEPTY